MLNKFYTLLSAFLALNFFSLSAQQADFKASIPFGQTFAVASANGDVCFYSQSADLITSRTASKGSQLNCLAVFDGRLFTGGDNGILVALSQDRSSKTYQIKGDILSMASYRGALFIGGRKGLLEKMMPDGSHNPVQIKIKGSITGLSTDGNLLYAVSDKGEIAGTRDGVVWSLLDFNTEYKGFYKPVSFTCVSVTQSFIAVAGSYTDGMPALFLSTGGKVWSERGTNYTDDYGISNPLTELPLAICYDAVRDQFLLACSNGAVTTIPSCSHCNKYYKLSTSDLYSISCMTDTYCVAGESSLFKTIKF